MVDVIYKLYLEEDSDIYEEFHLYSFARMRKVELMGKHKIFSKLKIERVERPIPIRLDTLIRDYTEDELDNMYKKLGSFYES